jgi:large subunit ribosomal protein L1
MSTEEKIIKAIKILRESLDKEKKAKFDQTIDLIINLKEFDVRRSAFNTFITLPNKIKDKKIIGLLEKKSKIIDSITKEEFTRYKEKKDSRRLVKSYDFFIANAKLMPAVATSFGRVLGPSGKMPSPQLGILVNEDDNTIKSLLNKINSTVRIRVKEPSIKVGIGKESLKDEQIAENILAVYNKIIENLPRNKDNIRNIKIKLTMSKPVLVEI